MNESPRVTETGSKSSNQGLLIGGYIAAAIFPLPVGFIMSVVTLVKGEIGHAICMFVLSVISIYLCLTLL